MTFIGALEKALTNALGREVIFDKVFKSIKPGDVAATYASTDKLQETIEEGLQRFEDWYVEYYNK
jgi:UDP-glucuronate 4-epimerase